jgi:ferritin
MFSEKMERALNDQSNAEMYSAYLYLAMSAYFESVSLKGFANWMMVQAQEEMTHAMKFYNFVNERGGRVVLKAIEAPPKEWAHPQEVFEAVLEHEKKVTGLINSLVDLAIEERDHASNIFLQWFVSEQVEEEDSANEVLQKIKLIGDARGNMFLLDRELGARVFTDSSQSAEE